MIAMINTNTRTWTSEGSFDCCLNNDCEYTGSVKGHGKIFAPFLTAIYIWVKNQLYEEALYPDNINGKRVYPYGGSNGYPTKEGADHDANCYLVPVLLGVGRMDGGRSG